MHQLCHTTSICLVTKVHPRLAFLTKRRQGIQQVRGKVPINCRVLTRVKNSASRCNNLGQEDRAPYLQSTDYATSMVAKL